MREIEIGMRENNPSARTFSQWYLEREPFWPMIRSGSPSAAIVFGLILFIIVVGTVLLSPSTESHFIYTDF